MVSVKFMLKRFNLFKRKSASEKKAEATQQAINHFCEIYRIPVGTSLTEIKTKLGAISDPTKKRIALGNFDILIRKLKRK